MSTTRAIHPHGPTGTGSHQAPSAAEHEAPQTIEGWYVLHDAWTVDWPALLAEPVERRRDLAAGLTAWLDRSAAEAGGSAAYAAVGQKGDWLFLHYRKSVSDLRAAAQGLKTLPIARHLRPAGGFLSVVEASLYEATAIAHGLLARRGLTPGTDGFDDALQSELAVQRAALEERVRRPIPAHSHVCFYPMSKRRGEQVNWYTLTMDERRGLMRSHGALGARFRDQVVQVISGAVGLDDWEWAVDLHADDPLVFKKLIYAMRFDEASAKYAEFGPFVVALKRTAQELVGEPLA
jgi:peroxiredoxin